MKLEKDGQGCTRDRRVKLQPVVTATRPGLEGPAQASDTLSRALEPSKPYTKAWLGSGFEGSAAWASGL